MKNGQLTFRDRIERIERTTLHVMRPKLYPRSFLKNYKNPLTLVSVQRRNANVTAPDGIARATREYTEALEDVAKFHCGSFAGGVNPHRRALELHRRVHTYLDEYLPVTS